MSRYILMMQDDFMKESFAFGRKAVFDGHLARKDWSKYATADKRELLEICGKEAVTAAKADAEFASVIARYAAHWAMELQDEQF